MANYILVKDIDGKEYKISIQEAKELLECI